jgi:RimJ/RimL family protein N-acetyltransferase
MLEGCSFETDRLSVDSWRSADNAAAVLLSHLTEEARQFLPDSLASIRTLDHAAEWLEQQEVEETDVLFAKLRSSSVTTAILVASEQSGSEAASLYIGYLVSPNHRGRGIATELVRGFARWVGEQTKIELIVAGVDSSHIASRSVLTKSGFFEVENSDTSADYLKYEKRIDR